MRVRLGARRRGKEGVVRRRIGRGRAEDLALALHACSREEEAGYGLLENALYAVGEDREVHHMA